MAFQVHPWKVVEQGFDKASIRLSESLTSTGNGYMGMRGNLEEDFSGDAHIGTYIGGVWFPDKTRVGWWKNGYPQYFGKSINAVRLMGFHVELDGEPLDLEQSELTEYYRELDLQTGVTLRLFSVRTAKGSVRVRVERFVSMAQKELLGVSYAITPDYEASVLIRPYLDARVHNLDSNYAETFWDMITEEETEDAIGLLTKTKENPFGTPRYAVAAAMACAADELYLTTWEREEGYVQAAYSGLVPAGVTACVEKLALCFTSRDHAEPLLLPLALKAASRAREVGYAQLIADHKAAWLARWQSCDVEILGDDRAQQGIRFNLFQLLSTYTGEDARLNIGPKGFTGEKYGGATYWDTEAFCLPVYLSIAGGDVARQLLLYRHMQLDGAYQNAAALGLQGALYPMVTFTGIECHNEWEITFEEIHRNGSIAYAIFHYVTYTGDEAYLLGEGLDVLAGVALFYADRAHFSQHAGQYMLHGVTGPNEYENNVNNNWYTNRIATWCIEYFFGAYEQATPERRQRLGLSAEVLTRMRDVAAHMYYPVDQALGIFLQQDLFLDKDIRPAASLRPEERPLNQHWSWDRILRSCFIKQADVLQGLYYFAHLYDEATLRRNFDFYEPITVHESSLSPCIHAVLAARLGYREKAMEMYARTARLDLDNINRDTDDGLHITSMPGSWLAIAQGFAGMRTINGLSLAPYLPEEWQGYGFQFEYRGRLIRLQVTPGHAKVTLLRGNPVSLTLCGAVGTLSDGMDCTLA